MVTDVGSRTEGSELRFDSDHLMIGRLNVRTSLHKQASGQLRCVRDKR